MGTRVKSHCTQDPTILVPTDLSDVAESALVHGLEIARACSGKVVLFHVISRHPDALLNMRGPDRLKINQDLKHFREKYEPQYKIPIETIVKKGNLFSALDKTAKLVKPLLMVMGTHGKQGLQHLYGSHAQRVVLGSTCPVLVVQKTPSWHKEIRILLTVSGETDSTLVIFWLLILAGVGKPVVHLIQLTGAGPEPDKQAGIAATLISDGLKGEGIACTLELAAPTHAAASPVIECAVSGSYNVIITMAMPATGISGFLFQNWNEQLMFNRTGIPVLFLVHPEPAS